MNLLSIVPLPNVPETDKKKIVILGGGFAGLKLARKLMGTGYQVILLDKNNYHQFQPLFYQVATAGLEASAISFPLRKIFHNTPNVTFRMAEALHVDQDKKRLFTNVGYIDYDYLVVALGADLDPAATPGLVEGGHEFYTFEGAFGLRDVLADFEGGRVVVGLTSTPFKCPPAPSETALLVHDFLTRRGLRDRSEISLVMPLGTPVPPSPEASEILLAAFAERARSAEAETDPEFECPDAVSETETLQAAEPAPGERVGFD